MASNRSDIAMERVEPIVQLVVLGQTLLDMTYEQREHDGEEPNPDQPVEAFKHD